MTEIFVAAGVGTGPTERAAYDTALADVGIGRFNLSGLSSVVPRDATIERVDAVPLDGTAGDVLHVVEARAFVGGSGTAAAGLGWARSADGPGVFYEASAVSATGATEAVEAELAAGLDHGVALRSWPEASRDRLVTVQPATDAGTGCALVVATVGHPRPPG